VWTPDYFNDHVTLGSIGNDHLIGTDANDQLYGGAGSDWLEGKGGDDILVGDNPGDGYYDPQTGLFISPGNDTLVGGTGDDVLIGAGGSDTYSFNVGDGGDTIIDTFSEGGSETNTIAFGTGITSSSLSLTVNAEGELVI